MRGDAFRLPLLDASVDAVTVASGIRNVQDLALACAEVHRVLRVGGRLMVLGFSLPRLFGLRAIYAGCFRHVVPLIGRLIPGHPSACSYVPESGLGLLLQTGLHAGFARLASMASKQSR